LPKVSDYFSEADCDYLVMDFVPGQELKELMDEARRQGGFLDEKEVLTWADQLCQALEYLHSQDPPVLHRDIKPSNIKLTPAGAIKLVDFGLVKLMAPDDTRTITVLQGRGTVQYTPLEQYGGDTGHTDVRSDIYSLGATLYQLLTGQPPLDAKQRFLEPGSLPSPRSLNPNLSLQTERALLRAIEMHPNQRPNSVAEFKGELLSQSSTVPNLLSLPATDEGMWTTALGENRTLFTIALTLLIVALVVTLFSPPLPATPAAVTPIPGQFEEIVSPSPGPH
jgi:serine/threonine-protein kinase